MLLNSFGQPTLITPENTCLNIEEFKESPLLLCHKNSLMGKLLPKDWSGCMYTSENILADIKKTNYKITNKQYAEKILLPNETVNITLNNQVNKGLYLDNHMQLTMIPLDGNNFAFIIKDENVTNLVTDNLTENMEAFVCNKTLRKILKDGTDVLYLNDGVYQKTPQLPIYPTECLLGALVTIVQPRYVAGISGNELPQYIYDCCRQEDLYSGY